MIVYFVVSSKGYLKNYEPKIPILASFYYLRESNIAYFRSKASSFFLDSGAYSAFTRNEKIDIDKYAQFIHNNIGEFDIYANLDAIGDWKASETNQKYLESCGLKPIPVYHYNEPLEVLKRMLSEYEYIGIGGSTQLDTKGCFNFFNECFELICNEDGTPKNRIHGFGLTKLKIMRHYPFYSVDSTAPLLQAAMGTLYDYEGHNLSLSRDKKIDTQTKIYLEKYYPAFDIEKLKNDYITRFLANIQFYNWVSEGLTKNPPRYFHRQNRLF